MLEAPVPEPGLLESLAPYRVIVCAGAGGVGKTTVAAAIALAFAERGQRVLCLTIDPAKRLADSLGVGHMTSEEQLVDPALFAAAGVVVSGSLTVLMLDTKRTFDELVRKHAPSPEAYRHVLENRVYRYVSTGLAGTQSYMAMEKVLAVQKDPRFDVIVLDTPPTSNALDFLDAPQRLIEAIDSPAMRWLADAFEKGGRFSFNLVARGVALVLRGLGRLTGKGFLEHLAEFVGELNDLFGGFRERAVSVAAAFRGPEFGYVLVTSPAPAAVEEVEFFAARLAEQGMHVDALIVNRVHAAPPDASPAQVTAALARHRLTLGPRASERLLQAAADERALAGADAAQLGLLDALESAALRAALRVHVPAMLGDVHDVENLVLVSRALRAGA